jgi:hypothetical protein
MTTYVLGADWVARTTLGSALAGWFCTVTWEGDSDERAQMAPRLLNVRAYLTGIGIYACGVWCRRRDLNPHGLRHTPLKRACLPFHHFGISYEVASRQGMHIIEVGQNPCQSIGGPVESDGSYSPGVSILCRVILSSSPRCLMMSLNDGQRDLLRPYSTSIIRCCRERPAR